MGIWSEVPGHCPDDSGLDMHHLREFRSGRRPVAGFNALVRTPSWLLMEPESAPYGQNPYSQQDPQARDSVAPGDFLTLGMRTAVVTDGNLERPDSVLEKQRRHFRIEAEPSFS